MNEINSYIEFEGLDVEEAIKKAVAKLKVSKKDLVIKVVCEEQKGLFGMNGAQSAKIRVKVKHQTKN